MKHATIPALCLPDAWAQHYHDLKRLGSGGYAHVYTARSVYNGKIVVIKILREDPPTAIDPQVHNKRALAHFAQETAILNLLMDRRIAAPRLHESNQVALVMDYVSDLTLRDLAKSQLSQVDIIQIGMRICAILAQLQSGSDPIIFCDLSLDNILVQDDFSLMLIDYGLARSEEKRLPAQLRGLGTPCFAAPELYTGEKREAEVSTKTDVFSLGAVLYTLFTRQSVPARTLSLSNQRYALLHLHVSHELTSLILRMLQLHPDKRPDVSEIEAELQSCGKDLAA